MPEQIFTITRTYSKVAKNTFACEQRPSTVLYIIARPRLNQAKPLIAFWKMLTSWSLLAYPWGHPKILPKFWGFVEAPNSFRVGKGNKHHPWLRWLLHQKINAGGWRTPNRHYQDLSRTTSTKIDSELVRSFQRLILRAFVVWNHLVSPWNILMFRYIHTNVHVISLRLILFEKLHVHWQPPSGRTGMTRSRGVGGHNGTPTSQRTSTARVLFRTLGFFPPEFPVGSPGVEPPPNLWLGKFVGIFWIQIKENKTNIQRSNMACSGRFNKPSPVAKLVARSPNSELATGEIDQFRPLDSWTQCEVQRFSWIAFLCTIFTKSIYIYILYSYVLKYTGVNTSTTL